MWHNCTQKKETLLHQTLETFLANITALHQLEPKNLPEPILRTLVKMPPEELFKTCSQLAVLMNNVPSKNAPITLSEEEIATLAETYLKKLIERLRS